MNKIEEKKIIVANTFTPSYDSIEDRIRVVINYQDIKNRIDLMITRNFILDFIPLTDEFLLTHYNKDLNIADGSIEIRQTINQTNKDEIEKQVQKNPNLSKTDHVNMGLLKIKDELLRRVDLSYNQKTKNTVITFTTNEHIIKSSLDKNLFQQIIKLIKSSIPYFKWGLSPNF